MNNTKARILSKLAALDSEKANKYLSRFASDLEATLQRTKSNDQIFESLDLLEQIIYQAPSKALRVIINIVNAKQPFKPTVRRYKGYRLEGKSHNTLIIKCLDLLGKIRYIKTEDVFELLVKLSGHQNNEVNTKAIGVLKELCQYNPFVMEKAGYYIQELIINEIKKWSSKKLAEHHGTILEITNRILQPSFSSHSMTDYKTFTLRQGTLVVNEKLINIRKDAVHLLKTIYAQSTELSHKKHILQVLNEATQTPIHGEYKDDMKQMIISNTNEIVDFYINILPDSENEIISVIEDQSHRFIQRFGADNLPKINQLQTMIESNPEYEMFRVFVGYDRGYLEGTDWKKAESMRKSKIQEYIADISEKNFKEWQKRLLSVIKNYTPNKHSEYLYFSNVFLFGLGEQKPSIALRLIQQNEKEFEPFLLRLIWGMWESKSSIIARELMSKWVEEDKHLQVCASLFAHDVKEVDIQILEKIFEKAKKYKDVTTLNNVIDSIVTNYSKCSEPKPLFIKSIKELTKNKNAGWVNNILHRPGSIWESLNEKDFEMIMENLLLVPRIDYHVEEILMPVANKYPQKAIHFFYKRVENKEKNKDDFSYDAIPFDLHNINEPLQKQAKVVIADIIKWYSQKRGRFEWEASHLIQAIFPAFNKELEKELIKLIKSKKEKNIKIVLSILRAYQGDPFLHNVCKNIVRHSPYVGKFKSSLFIILSQTGIVSGEDGFVNAYKQKLEDVQSWKKERSKAIRSFIKEYEDNLNKRILEEQKRADEDLELRKREFGE